MSENWTNFGVFGAVERVDFGVFWEFGRKNVFEEGVMASHFITHYSYHNI